MSILLGFSLAVVQEQKIKEEDIFSSVQIRLQTQLEKRLKLYIEYERQQDYGNLYDLFSDETKHPVFLENSGWHTPLENKDSYVQFRRTSNPKILGFKPKSISKLNNGTYEIRGQATLSYEDECIKRDRIIYARLQNDIWYFSDLAEELID
jgi:hypothetical protein